MRVTQSHVKTVGSLLREALITSDICACQMTMLGNTYRTVYLTPKLTRDGFIIPVICGRHTLRVIFTYASIKMGYPNIFAPVYINNCNKRKVNTPCNKILRIMDSCGYQQLLLHYLIDDNPYYIGQGIMLDGNFSPVIMMAVEIREHSLQSNNTRPIPYSYRLYITDELINEGLSPMSKYIGNILMPAFITASRFYFLMEKKANIIIGDEIDEFIHVPALMDKDAANVSSIANKLLMENKQAIINSLYHGKLGT